MDKLDNGYARSGIDDLIRAADSLLTINDYDEAKRIYSNAVEYYPNDYRGWWGKAKILSRNFSCYVIEPIAITGIKAFVSRALAVAKDVDKLKIEEEWNQFERKQKSESKHFSDLSFIHNKLVNDQYSIQKSIETSNCQIGNAEDNIKSLFYILIIPFVILCIGIYEVMNFNYFGLIGVLPILPWIWAYIRSNKDIRLANIEIIEQTQNLEEVNYQINLLNQEIQQIAKNSEHTYYTGSEWHWHKEYFKSRDW
jgi:hypothetical protein